MDEPSDDTIRAYMAETGFGYQVAKAMLLKAVVDQVDAAEDE
jgi:hypothetical protein